MRLKTFRAFTLSEALGAVKSDLGEHAVVLHTRTFKRGGFFGLGGREIVEVIASESDSEIEASTPVVERPANAQPVGTSEVPSSTGVAAARAYGSSSSTTSVVREDATSNGREDLINLIDLPVSSGSLEVDREKTRKLAQALAIRLERQQAARSSAGVAGPDDVITRSVEAPKKATAETGPAAVVHTERTVPGRDAPQRFIIGEGGVLLPEVQEAAKEVAVPSVVPSTDLSREPAPRVIALERETERSILAPTVSNPNELDEPIAAVTPAVIEAAGREANAVEDVSSATLEVGGVAPLSVASNAADAVDEADATPETDEKDATDATDELVAIRNTVGRMLANGGPSAVDRSSSESSESLGRPEALTEAYASLIAQELSRDLAERVIAVLQDELDPKSLANPKRVREALLVQISALVPTAEDLEFVKPRDGRPRTIAFVGPTGVGKTTTLAKIAATMTLREEIRVGLVTADTYRIAAVDQLRTYADILGLRLEVASDPAEMRAALDRCSDLDAVLIDTPGRSQNDADRIADLRALIDAARPHETHLVLSGTAAERVLLREAEAFSTLGPDRVVLTKLDEAVTFGMLVSVVRRIGRRISWVTTGQEVPNDVERATSERLANLMLGEPVKS
jgi:flagellar biosynthesis protein FlhF